MNGYIKKRKRTFWIQCAQFSIQKRYRIRRLYFQSSNIKIYVIGKPSKEDRNREHVRPLIRRIQFRVKQLSMKINISLLTRSFMILSWVVTITPFLQYRTSKIRQSYELFCILLLLYNIQLRLYDFPVSL